MILQDGASYLICNLIPAETGGFVCTRCGWRYGKQIIRRCRLPKEVSDAPGDGAATPANHHARGLPGTELKRLLKRFGIAATEGCKCTSRAAMMDRNGIDWCEANIETIVDWLQEEATRRKLPFVRLAGKTLVRLAIRAARRAAG